MEEGLPINHEEGNIVKGVNLYTNTKERLKHD